MGHYDMNNIIIRMSGVFGGNTKNVKQVRINELLKKAFGYDFLSRGWPKRDDKIWDKLSGAAVTELREFVRGHKITCGTKGECFSVAKIDNFREHKVVVDEWMLITKKCPNCFGPITIITCCEDKESAEISVVGDGKVLDDNNFWMAVSIIGRVT